MWLGLSHMQAVDTSCWRTIVKADKVDIDTNGVCVLLNLERLYYFVLVQDFQLTLDCQPMRTLMTSLHSSSVLSQFMGLSLKHRRLLMSRSTRTFQLLAFFWNVCHEIRPTYLRRLSAFERFGFISLNCEGPGIEIRWHLQAGFVGTCQIMWGHAFQCFVRPEWMTHDPEVFYGFWGSCGVLRAEFACKQDL